MKNVHPVYGARSQTHDLQNMAPAHAKVPNLRFDVDHHQVCCKIHRSSDCKKVEEQRETIKIFWDFNLFFRSLFTIIVAVDADWMDDRFD